MSSGEEDASKLNPMETAKLKELFNKIDKNRDGKIDIIDLSTALSELKVAQLPGHAQVLFYLSFQFINSLKNVLKIRYAYTY